MSRRRKITPPESHSDYPSKTGRGIVPPNQGSGNLPKKIVKRANLFSQQLTSTLQNFIQEEIARALSNPVNQNPMLKNGKSIFHIPFGWRRIPIKLKAFYDELHSRRLIICSQEEFESLFNGDPIPIWWLGTLRELAYIFNSLMHLRIIYRSNKLHILLSSNFLGGDSQPLNVGSLKSTLKRVRQGGPDLDLDLIIATCQ